MADLRQGSPEYLSLLRSLRWTPSTPPDWYMLDTAWDRVIQKPGTYQLRSLATVAMALVAEESQCNLNDLLNEAERLHIDKNAGYAGLDQPDPWSNFRMATAFGITPFNGVLVRLSDKYIRTVNLRRDPSNERIGESLVDTLFDLAAYALIAICLMEEVAAA